MSDLDTKVRTITPEQAQRWITRHETLAKRDPAKRNRRLKKSLIYRYAADMAADRWHLNGETLKIGSDGRIIDGQHRLAACVKSDHSFRTLVVENVDDESFKTIDVGKVRTAGDLLYIDGHHSGALLGAALVNMWRWDLGEGRSFQGWEKSPTKPEIFEVLEKYPKLEEGINRYHALRAFMSPGLGAALVYILTERDHTMAELFFESLVTGLNLKATDPVYALRERLIKDRQQNPRPPASLTAEMVLRAWHATKKGEQLTRMQRPRKDKAKK